MKSALELLKEHEKQLAKEKELEKAKELLKKSEKKPFFKKKVLEIPMAFPVADENFNRDFEYNDLTQRMNTLIDNQKKINMQYVIYSIMIVIFIWVAWFLK
jgi:hypothetical protein